MVLECICSGNDCYLIEINPRFPAWIYLATGIGINLPERLMQYLNGEEHNYAMDYPSGKLFIRYSNDMVCDMDVFQQMISTGEKE